jgi:hypothetical protein
MAYSDKPVARFEIRLLGSQMMAEAHLSEIEDLDIPMTLFK